MTASPPISHSTRFVALEQADFQRLEHAGYLKGLFDAACEKLPFEFEINPVRLICAHCNGI